MVKYENKLSLKERILNYLIEHKESQITIRQMSKELNTDYKNTFQAINRIPNLILKEKVGNSSLIKIRFKPSQELFSVESKRTAQFLEENKQFQLIKEDTETLNYPFFTILIFGSLVKKNHTKRSDVDLCVISDNEEKTEKLVSKLELLPIRLEIHNFTTEEFVQMLRTKEENIGKEIVKNNIILYGLENYYNLISKWMEKE